MESAKRFLKEGEAKEGSIFPSGMDNLTPGGHIPLCPEEEKFHKNISNKIKEHPKRWRSVVPPTKVRKKKMPIRLETKGHSWGEMWQQGNLQLVLCDPRSAPYPKATKEAGGGSTREGAQHKMQIMTPRSTKKGKEKENKGQRKEGERVGQHKGTTKPNTTRQTMQSRWRWCEENKKGPRKKGHGDPKSPNPQTQEAQRRRDHKTKKPLKKKGSKGSKEKGKKATKRTTEGPKDKKGPHMAQERPPKATRKDTRKETTPKDLQARSTTRGNIDRGTLPLAKGYAKGFVRFRTFLHYVEH